MNHFFNFFGLATIFLDFAATFTFGSFIADTFLADPVTFLLADAEEDFLAGCFLGPFLAIFFELTLTTFLFSSAFFAFRATFLAAAFSACLSLSFSTGETLKLPDPVFPASAPGTRVPSSTNFFKVFLTSKALGTVFVTPAMCFIIAEREEPFFCFISMMAWVIMAAYVGFFFAAVLFLVLMLAALVTFLALTAGSGCDLLATTGDSVLDILKTLSMLTAESI